MSKDLWQIDYDRIGEDFADGTIDAEEAADRLRRLGFDPGEIADHLEALQA